MLSDPICGSDLPVTDKTPSWKNVMSLSLQAESSLVYSLVLMFRLLHRRNQSG